MDGSGKNRAVYMVTAWSADGGFHREWGAHTRDDAYRIMDDWMANDAGAVRVAVDLWVGDNHVRRLAIAV